MDVTTGLGLDHLATIAPTHARYSLVQGHPPLVGADLGARSLMELDAHPRRLGHRPGVRLSSGAQDEDQKDEEDSQKQVPGGKTDQMVVHVEGWKKGMCHLRQGPAEDGGRPLAGRLRPFRRGSRSRAPGSAPPDRAACGW